LLLLVRIDVFRHFHDTFSDVMPRSQLCNRRDRVLKLRLRFLGFFKGALLLNFKKIVKYETLIMVVHQLEYFFTIVRTNLRAWPHVLMTG
jgi:hypothetical protein